MFSPHMVSQMIGVGEQTGAMDAMLGKIAVLRGRSRCGNRRSAGSDRAGTIAFLGITIGSIVFRCIFLYSRSSANSPAGKVIQENLEKGKAVLTRPPFLIAKLRFGRIYSEHAVRYQVPESTV